MENSFKDYLETQHYSLSTIQEHQNNIHRFKRWSIEEQLDHQMLNYRELLAYIQQEKAKKLTERTINIRLNTITKYYDHLTQLGHFHPKVDLISLKFGLRNFLIADIQRVDNLSFKCSDVR